MRPMLQSSRCMKVPVTCFLATSWVGRARALITSKMVLESLVQEWEPGWLAKGPFQGPIHAGKVN